MKKFNLAMNGCFSDSENSVVCCMILSPVLMDLILPGLTLFDLYKINCFLRCLVLIGAWKRLICLQVSMSDNRRLNDED